MRRIQRFLRATHKWLAFLLGIQLLIWAATGFYMVAVRLDFIHGDFLVRSSQIPLREASLIPIAELASRFDGVMSVKVFRSPVTEEPLYEIKLGDQRKLVNALTGADISVSRRRIEALAMRYYSGRGRIERIELIEQLPTEVRGRPTPLWRIDFDDSYQTTFYLDPVNGSLVTRRHRWWRLFDVAWMLHIMDYGAERDDVNNSLLRWTAILGLASGLTGLGLLFFSFRRGARA